MKSLFARFVLFLGLAITPLCAQADIIVSENNPYGNGTQGILRGSDLGGPLTPWIPLGSGGLNQPVGMRINPLTGNLLVASKGTGDIKQYNATTGAYIGNFASGISGPANIQISPDNTRVLVSQFGGTGVNVYNTNGTTVGLPYTTLSDPGISGATSLLYSGSNILVSSFNGGIYSFNAATGVSNGLFASDASLTGATGMAIFGNNLFVSNIFGQNILRFNATTGAYIGVFATIPDLVIPNGNGPGLDLSLEAFPAQLSANLDGSLLVSLTGQGVVGYVSSGGTYLGPYAYGGGLQVPGEFAFVAAIPEPSTLVGLGLAGVGMLWHYRRRKAAAAA